MSAIRAQTPAEELANSLTSGFGLVISMIGVALAEKYAVIYQNSWIIVSVAIYGTTLCLMYLASTLYHSAKTPRVRYFWNVFDHAAIYLLIAGTYTPYTLGPLRTVGAWGWSLFGVVWALAFSGVVFKLYHFHHHRVFAVATYLLMGWFVVIAIEPLRNAVGISGILWLLAGGLCYTFGIVFYAWKSARFTHAIWHLFVLGGSILHFIGILTTIVLPI